MVVLNAAVTNSGVQTEVAAQFHAVVFLQFPGDLAVFIVEITKDQGIVVFRTTGLDASRGSTFIDTMNAHSAGFDCSLATWCPGLLVMQVFVNEAACLVWASHHAVATTDADVFVDQYDTVFTAERRAGRTHVNTRCCFAVLAHEGQCLGVTGRLVFDLDGPYPLGALFWC